MRSISARVTAGMSEDFGNCSNYDAKPFAKAIMPHRDYTEVLSFWRSTADDARRLQSQVDAVSRELSDGMFVFATHGFDTYFAIFPSDKTRVLRLMVVTQNPVASQTPTPTRP